MNRLITTIVKRQLGYALNSYASRSKLVDECKGNLNLLCSTNKVRVEWIPGHLGIPGNEKADYLARKGSAQVLVAAEPTCEISLGFARSHIKAIVSNKFILHWVQTRKTTHSKLFLVGPCHKRSNSLLLMDRNTIGGLQDCILVTVN